MSKCLYHQAGKWSEPIQNIFKHYAIPYPPIGSVCTQWPSLIALKKISSYVRSLFTTLSMGRPYCCVGVRYISNVPNRETGRKTRDREKKYFFFMVKPLMARPLIREPYFAAFHKNSKKL